MLVYMHIKGLRINFGAVVKDNMRRLRDNYRWKFYYGSLLNQFFKDVGIKEEEAGLHLPLARHLVSKMMDVTK
ncbi:hypothetical protein HAX54_013700, partial [Datura stramonium]|nr:hypothetical protein [Datura stramonium]